MDDSRYVKLKDSINFTEFDAQVFITNEEIDKGVLAQNLLGVLQVAPQFQEQTTKQLFDIMGLQFKPEEREELPLEQAGGQLQGAPTQSAVDLLTQATTAQGAQAGAVA